MNKNLLGNQHVSAKLLECAKLPTAAKMAIFEDRQIQILNFLASEHYSGLKNITLLLGTYKQTAIRIMKRLCYEQYISKYNIDTTFRKNTVIYQITNTGMMLAANKIASTLCRLQLQKLSFADSAFILRLFQLQELRLSLQNLGYRQFQKPWQLQQLNHPILNDNYKMPEYICLDGNGNKIAIEYEIIIQSSDTYQKIIACYIAAIQASVIEKVVFFTRKEFVVKLKDLFTTIATTDISKDLISTKFDFLEHTSKLHIISY